MNDECAVGKQPIAVVRLALGKRSLFPSLDIRAVALSEDSRRMREYTGPQIRNRDRA